MALPFRAARFVPPRSQSLIASCTLTSYTSTCLRAATPARRMHSSTGATRPSALLSSLAHRSRPHRPISIPSPRRLASTTTEASSASSSTRAPSHRETPETLTWNRFLALRRIRRRVSLVSSIICGVAFTGVGIVVLTTVDLDAMGAQVLGLDPIIVMGLSTFAFTGLGWLLGPFFGNAAFNFWYRAWAKEIARKEREFYARIKRYRVDPGQSSLSNPVPDYYGEKIGSVADYRRWLKDQRAFNLKTGNSRRLIKRT